MKLMRVPRTELWNWSHPAPLTNLREEINRLFEAPFGLLERPADFFHGWSPALDLWENKEDLVVQVELPGMKKESIEVWFEDGALHVSGERQHEAQGEEATLHRVERYCGRFHRTVSLPKPVNADKIKAAYEDGILTVSLPKTEEARPRSIEITTH